MPLLSSSLPNQSADVVGVLDAQSFQPVFQQARPMKTAVREDATVMKHPLETGAQITDHIVFNPLEIQVSFVLPNNQYQQLYSQFQQAYKAGKLFVLQTRTGSYKNVIIASMPHDEDAAMFDAIALAVTFHEVDFITPEYGKLPAQTVKKSVNASTVKRGQVSPKTLAAGSTNSEKTTFAYGVWKSGKEALPGAARKGRDLLGGLKNYLSK